ncbi:MAG: hypothetical protein V1825_00865 [Candidatus Falkowbacteria bacterium]
MAKIKHPIKEFWESDKKPNYLEVSKTKDSSVKIVKFIKPKSKNKKK